MVERSGNSNSIIAIEIAIVILVAVGWVGVLVVAVGGGSSSSREEINSRSSVSSRSSRFLRLRDGISVVAIILVMFSPLLLLFQLRRLAILGQLSSINPYTDRCRTFLPVAIPTRLSLPPSLSFKQMETVQSNTFMPFHTVSFTQSDASFFSSCLGISINFYFLLFFCSCIHPASSSFVDYKRARTRPE